MTVNLPHLSVDADLVLQQIYFQAITVFFARKTENGFLHKRSMRYLKKCVTQIAGKSIIEAAEAKADADLLFMIRDVDFIAHRGVHYHNQCRKEYTRNLERRPHANIDSELLAQQNAHNKHL